MKNILNDSFIEENKMVKSMLLIKIRSFSEFDITQLSLLSGGHLAEVLCPFYRVN